MERKEINEKGLFGYSLEVDTQNEQMFRYILDLEEHITELELGLLSLKKLLNDKTEKIVVRDYSFLDSHKGKSFMHYDKVHSVRMLYESRGLSYSKIGDILGLDYRVVSNIINRRYNEKTNEKINELWDSLDVLEEENTVFTMD